MGMVPLLQTGGGTTMKFTYEITSGKCEYKGEVEAHDCRDAILRAFAKEFGDTDLSASAPFNSLLEWTGGHESMSQFKELDKDEPGATIFNDDSTFIVYVEEVA